MISLRKRERRTANRRPCADPHTVCEVVSVLDQNSYPARFWDVSQDGSGACLVMEPQFSQGARLMVELRNDLEDIRLRGWVEVRHSEICCPSLVDMYMHGCYFVESLPTEQVRMLV